MPYCIGSIGGNNNHFKINVMTPKEKAFELVADCIQIQLSNTDLESQYEMAKIQAEYSANTAKWSHEANTEKFVYWEKVKQEIQLL